VLVLWGLITHGTYAGTGDEPHYAMIAHSIAFDRDFDLANNYADQQNLVFGGALDPGNHAVRGKDGTLRPVHDVGLPLLFAPYYAAAYWIAQQAGTHLPPRVLQRAKLNQTVILRHLLSFAMIAITAWIAVQLFTVFVSLSGPAPSKPGVRRVEGHPTRAAWWAALFVLTPPLLSHSFLFFTEILSAAITLWVVRSTRRSPVPRTVAALAGAATGLLFLIHARNAGLVIGLGAIAVWQWFRRDRIALGLFAVGATVALAARTAVTFHFWGTWLTTPIAWFGSTPGVVAWLTELSTRLLGWLLDPEHGLLPYAPIYALLPFGWVALYRKDRAFAIALTLVVVAYVGCMAIPSINLHGWRGGWSPAARFLVPIVPLLAIAVFAYAGTSPKLKVPVAVLLAVQIAANAFFWQHPKLLWNDGDGVSAVALYVRGATK
jgi:hypothetical protein